MKKYRLLLLVLVIVVFTGLCYSSRSRLDEINNSRLDRSRTPKSPQIIPPPVEQGYDLKMIYDVAGGFSLRVTITYPNPSTVRLLFNKDRKAIGVFVFFPNKKVVALKRTPEGVCKVQETFTDPVKDLILKEKPEIDLCNEIFAYATGVNQALLHEPSWYSTGKASLAEFMAVSIGAEKILSNGRGVPSGWNSKWVMNMAPNQTDSDIFLTKAPFGSLLFLLNYGEFVIISLCLIQIHPI